MKATDVFALVKACAAFALPDDETVLLFCDRALTTVCAHCKAHVSEDDPLVAPTAAALARFHLFVQTFGGDERFSSFKAGDLTITKDRAAELAFETRLRDEALAAAASILTDGGFVFETI